MGLIYRIVGLLLVITLLSTPSIIAQTTLSGEIGLDLENFGFDNSLKDTSRNFSVTRSQSRHYLNLNLGGPLVTDNFAIYSLSSRLFGTYYSANTNEEKSNSYQKPNLNTFNGSLSLFPKRPYSLRFYMMQNKDFSIRYEMTNKSKIDILSPELAVIRRYKSNLSSRGAAAKIPLRENMDFSMEFQNSGMEVRRSYDFGEDLDIWVAFTNLLLNPIAQYDTVEVINSLPDDDVLLFIDNNLIDSISSGNNLFVEVDSGYHNIDIFPVEKYNAYRNRVHIQGNMKWEIVYKNPATPNDLDQTTDNASGALRFGGDGRFNNEARIDYSSSGENVQRIINKLTNIRNNASYEISRNVRLETQTNYSRNRNTITGISSQLNNSLDNQTMFRWDRRNGISGSISHNYINTSNETGDVLLKSTTQTVNNQLTYPVPVKSFSYEVDMKNSVTRLSDNMGYENSQYSTDIHNDFTFRIGGVMVEPRNQTKLSITSQKNPDQKGNEIENKIDIRTQLPEIKRIGEFIVKTSFEWRRKSSEGKSDIKRKYIFDLTYIRKFLENYKLTLLTTQERETYGGSTPTPGANPDQKSAARKPQVVSTYRIDLQAKPRKNIILGGNFMIIKQKSATITKMGLSAIADIPLLNIPVKSFVARQSRDLAGLPKQTQLTSETSLSYRFRQITFLLTFNLNRENLLNERYNYSEIYGKISRQFSIL